MRFGLLTQWYDPEPGPAALPGALARGLQARGHEVSVLTGFPNYPTGRILGSYHQRFGFTERLDDVTVHRTPLFPSHDSRMSRRLLNYASFAASAAVSASALRFFKGLDAVWVNYSPISIAAPLWLGQITQGTPAVVEVGDLWPDTVYASGMASTGPLGRLADAAMTTWCNQFYKSATSVVYISPGAGKLLNSRGVPAGKLHFVPKWADESTFHPRSKGFSNQYDIPDGHRVLLYAGSLGEAQGIDVLVRACATLTHLPLVCLIAGSGTHEQKLKHLADRLGAHNVRFIGRVPQNDMTDLMATADFSYIGLRPHPLSAVTMPSKTQASLAAGKPILAAASGDLVEFVKTTGTGVIADSADSDSVANAITEICGWSSQQLRSASEKSLQVYQETFSESQGVRAIEELLVQAAESRKEHHHDRG